MKLLLTGANGQLGLCFQDLLPAGWQCLALGSAELDISKGDAVKQQVAQFSPDIIVNAGAYTAVDQAESEAERAAAVNATGPCNLAVAAKRASARFFHISTDYVFEGNGQQPYTETDPVYPLSVYGKTKLAGELLVQSILPEAVILRTAWVFSEYRHNFLKTMLRLGKERPELGIVADQVGCPTYAGDIAAAIISMARQQAAGGIYHYCGDKPVSWAEFATAIFSVAGQKGLLTVVPKVNALTTAEFPTVAKRPAWSVMSTSKIAQYYPASDWQSAIQTVLERLA